MLNRTAIALVVSLSLGVVAEEAAAQIQRGIDVKTALRVKQELKVVKQGVLLAIREAPTTTVKEAGEDYALVLEGVTRTLRGDIMQVDIEVALCEPTGLGTCSTLLEQRTVTIRYDYEEAQEYAREHIDASMLANPWQDPDQLAADIGSMMAFVARRPGNPFGYLSSALIVSLVVVLAEALDQDPSPIEVMESLNAGQAVFDALAAMMRAHPR